MASRIQCSVLIIALLLPAAPVLAEAEADGVRDDATLIDPRIERRRIREAQIDSENIEIGFYTGLLAVENFETSPVIGVRAAWHVSEDLFFEASYARADVGDTSFEQLSGGVELLTDSEREWRYFGAVVGYNLLPGEAFLGSRRAFANNLYLLGGAGSTDFAGDNRFTLTVGAGYRLLLTDWISVRIEMRDYLYELDTFGNDEITNNLEWSIGIGGFF